VILLESLQRRTVFLTECAARLGLPHVQVIRGRAEDQAGQLAVDVVVARAVAPLTRLVEWSLPLLRSGGMLLAIKGASAEQEVAAAAPRLVRLGAFEWDVRRVGGPDVDPPTTVVRIAAGERSSAGRPGRKSTRRAGVRSRSVGRSTGGAPRRGEG
jgi:16S rRNA (guanine527-N7)-methyltransferase